MGMASETPKRITLRTVARGAAITATDATAGNIANASALDLAHPSHHIDAMVRPTNARASMPKMPQSILLLYSRLLFCE